MLTKEQILAAADVSRLAREQVDVPALGGTVCVREMTGRERNRYDELSMARPKDEGEDYIFNYADASARLASFCLCDEQGKRLFAEADIPGLSALSSLALEAICRAARRVNRMRLEDEDQAVKNLPPGQDA